MRAPFEMSGSRDLAIFKLEDWIVASAKTISTPVEGGKLENRAVGKVQESWERARPRRETPAAPSRSILNSSRNRCPSFGLANPQVLDELIDACSMAKKHSRGGSGEQIGNISTVKAGARGPSQGHGRFEWTEKVGTLSPAATRFSQIAHCSRKRVRSDGGASLIIPTPVGFSAIWPKRLDQPQKWERQMIFVNSMSDLFGRRFQMVDCKETVSMEEADWHTFQILTKRPDRLMELPRVALAFECVGGGGD